MYNDDETNELHEDDSQPMLQCKLVLLNAQNNPKYQSPPADASWATARVRMTTGYSGRRAERD